MIPCLFYLREGEEHCDASARWQENKTKYYDVPKIAKSGADRPRTLEEAEKRHIIEALNTTGWRVSGKDGAAEVLDINPKTLESMMQRLGIQRSKKNA